MKGEIIELNMFSSWNMSQCLIIWSPLGQFKVGKLFLGIINIGLWENSHVQVSNFYVLTSQSLQIGCHEEMQKNCFTLLRKAHVFIRLKNLTTAGRYNAVVYEQSQ